ncbi:multidrug effflux MFS transporter [Nocardia sp. NPDC004068]|uniref:multidrug effflux MFS transporter n=1 Tax=Nocardia sp. NPDC004068 TaxID=3364303 RepID=UPI00368451B6
MVKKSEPGRGRTAAVIVLLGALTAVGPLAIDMYVPGFPQMGRSLTASDTGIQLSLTAFLAGMVVGQLLLGPISDSLGRRRLLLGGTVLFAVLSLACALAPNIVLFNGFRFLEGVAGAAGTVLARAVLTDLFHGPRLPGYFSLLAMVLGVAPVIAPVIGTAILSAGTWRTVFVVLAAFGLALFVAVLCTLPESLPPAERHTGGFGGTFRAMGGLLRNRAFVGCGLTLGFAAAALFSYIGSSSFVFQDVYGTSAAFYGMVFAVNAGGMMAASALFGALSRRFAVPVLLAAYCALAASAAAVHVALVLTVGGNAAITWVCLFFTVAGVGGVFPASMTLGQTLGRPASGAASALLGGAQFLFGALASPVAGAFGGHSALPMAAVMLVVLACGAAAFTTLVPLGRNTGAAAAELERS